MGRDEIAPQLTRVESLLAEYLANGDMTSRHSITVHAPPDITYSAITRLEVSRSPLIRALFWLRGLRNTRNLAQLRTQGFIPLVERPGEAIAMGVAGRFWKPSGQVQRLAPEEFRRFREPGTARGVWAFVIEPLGEQSCRVVTSTRVACTDAASRRKFRLYWLLVGPFSGLIRRECLRLIKEAAEATHGSSGEPHHFPDPQPKP